MHAPLTPPHPGDVPLVATPVLATRPTARTESEQNGTFRNTNSPIALPTFTPPSPHLPTTPSPHLTPRQFSAISLLCSGLNLDTVAARLHIGRTTLYTWRTAHPAFRAELARRQQELRDTASRRLRLTLLRAVAEINGQFSYARRDDRVRTALALLRHCDLRSLLADPADPLTPAACLDDQIRHDRASRKLDPDLPIDDADRDEYLAHLDATGTFADPPPSPTHRRLTGTAHATPAPCPAPTDAPAPPDPDFQI